MYQQAQDESNVPNASEKKARRPQAKSAAAEQAAAAAAGIQYWLIKSEPDEYPLESLRDEPNGQGFWDGVRNAVARNNMQKMNVGDLCLFYHSSCKVPCCVGICEVAVEAAVDKTALDSKHKYFDPKSDPAKVICLQDVPLLCVPFSISTLLGCGLLFRLFSAAVSFGN